MQNYSFCYTSCLTLSHLFYRASAFGIPLKNIATKWAEIPSGVDVLITHSPPAGIADIVRQILCTLFMALTSYFCCFLLFFKRVIMASRRARAVFTGRWSSACVQEFMLLVSFLHQHMVRMQLLIPISYTNLGHNHDATGVYSYLIWLCI